MRLKDLLRSAVLYTRVNLFGEAANDDGVSVERTTLAYVANGETDRMDRTVKLAANWRRIQTLVGDALAYHSEEADLEIYAGLAALHEAIKSIADRTEETSVFQNTVELGQDDIDALITNMSSMATVARHYNRIIREGTTFLGLDIDEENDQILIDNIENGPAQYARQHLDEVQMFAFRARSHLTQYASPLAKPDEQALGL